jgi:uncharacterized protein YbbK (DUF523 family)
MTLPTRANLPERDSKILIGISACLLGHEVRYDGGHKLNVGIRDSLGEGFIAEAICPEFEIGLGVPRETLGLFEGVEQAANPRMVAHESRSDHSDAMRRHCRKRIGLLMERGICGFIAKEKSPSCGPDGIVVMGQNGEEVHRKGRGLFIEVLLEYLPELPVEDEAGLVEASQREAFLAKVVAYHDR